ncbi:MAG: EF-hand domain-containing protein [Sulfurospirillum sp.]|nr:EF-hand domain-containing protein [Sulfurospirillum sp.]
MKKFISLVAILAISSSIYAASHSMPNLEAYDSNKDGYLSATEFDAMKTQRMTENAEAGKMMKNAGKSPLFSEIDKNGDGKISKDEMKAGCESHVTAKKGQKENMQKQGNMQGHKGGMQGKMGNMNNDQQAFQEGYQKGYQDGYEKGKK